MRIAIYARYSSELQNPKSTADQIADCQRLIAQTFAGYDEPVVFYDDALSGQYEHKRTQFLEMKNAIRAQKFDVIVAEGLDRLARDSVDNTMFFRICTYRKVRILTIQEGEVDVMKAALKGVMNEMYTQSLGAQVKRSQRNRAMEGKIFGLSYGYKIKIENGREVRGDREIVPEQAEVIREIFTLFADGHSLSSIVQLLNAQNIPSPSGRQWTQSSLSGKRQRRDGILNKQIYRGIATWNLTSLNVNPETKGINYEINDESDQVSVPREDLRIISEELWARCEERKSVLKKRAKTSRKRIINPLHRIIYCGLCMGKKTLANRTRYVCSNYRRYRTCTNARGQPRKDILEWVFTHLHEDFAALDVKELVSRIVAQRQEADSDTLEELANLNDTIDTLVSLIREKNIHMEELVTKLDELNKERFELTKQAKKIKRVSDKKVHKTLESALKNLERDLKGEQFDDANHLLLKSLIDRIVFVPKSTRYGEDATITLQNNRWLTFYNLVNESAT